MTDREAIEYAENELESTGYTLETNNKLRGGLFKILSTKFEFLVTAKSALQEREERSKGCKYCTGVVLNVVEETTAFEAGFNFCPMCGRKLKGEDND